MKALKLTDLDRPPLGILPEWLWFERHPEPTADDRRQRIEELEALVVRYARAGRRPRAVWVAELAVRRMFDEMLKSSS